METGTSLITIRKHWFAYVFPALAILFFLPGLVLMSTTGISIFGLASVVVILYATKSILESRAVSWRLTTEEVIIESGYLPWFRSYRSIPIEDIYEAFSTRPMLGAALGFGSVHIRRTEGTTSHFLDHRMAKSGQMAWQITELVRPLKKKTPTQVTNTLSVNISLADELTKLGLLKQQGLLSDGEYQQACDKLLGRV